MAALNFFGKDKRSENGSGSVNKNFYVIIADTEWQTFEALSDIKENYNFMNLSSEFAVNFILDYEKIDIIIISRKIGGLEAIVKKAERKKTKVYILGKDLSYPVDREEVFSLLEKEYDKKILLKQAGSSRHIMPSFEKIFRFKPKDSTRPGKLSGKVLANKKHTEMKHAEKKHANIKPDKKQDKKSQFYNDFWKDVALEANDNYLDSEGIEKPDHNMHEYGKNNIWSSKQDLTVNTEREKEGFLDFDLHNSKKYMADGNFESDDYKINDFDDSRPESSFIQNLDVNNSGKKLQAGKNESLIPMPGKVITIKQKIMVFVKAKGGVGSTFLSLYLAYEFRKLKTLLIDLNFSEGGSDIGYYLGMPKTPNMVIFTEGYNRISMDNSVISFKGHFDILQSPPSYDLTKKLDMQDIYSIVDVAKKKYHLLIFDLPNQINEIFFGVLDMADLAIMVSDYTPGSIGRLASINKRFIYNDMEKILVLNKNKNNNSHSFIKNNISEFFSLKEIVNIDENSLLSGKSDFQGCDFSNYKDMQGFKKKVMESLTYD